MSCSPKCAQCRAERRKQWVILAVGTALVLSAMVAAAYLAGAIIEAFAR